MSSLTDQTSSRTEESQNPSHGKSDPAVPFKVGSKPDAVQELDPGLSAVRSDKVNPNTANANDTSQTRAGADLAVKQTGGEDVMRRMREWEGSAGRLVDE